MCFSIISKSILSRRVQTLVKKLCTQTFTAIDFNKLFEITLFSKHMFRITFGSRNTRGLNVYTSNILVLLLCKTKKKNSNLLKTFLFVYAGDYLLETEVEKKAGVLDSAAFENIYLDTQARTKCFNISNDCAHHFRTSEFFVLKLFKMIITIKGIT